MPPNARDTNSMNLNVMLAASETSHVCHALTLHVIK